MFDAGAFLIVFREIIEAGLIIGIVLAATTGVPGSKRMVALGVVAVAARPGVGVAGRAVSPLGSVTENHAAEALQREDKIDATDRGHREKPRPDNRETGAAIEDSLREVNEMGCWADNSHQILKPHRLAFHWRHATRQHLYDEENGSCE